MIWQGDFLAVVGHRLLARENFTHDGDVIFQAVIRPAPGFAIPALDDLRAGYAEAGDEAPPAGQRIHCTRAHRRVGGRAGGDLHDAGGEFDPFRLAGEKGQRGNGVGPVSLRRPHGIVTKSLGPLHERDWDIQMRFGIADRQAEFHGVVSPYFIGLYSVGRSRMLFISNIVPAPLATKSSQSLSWNNAARALARCSRLE